MYRGHPFSSTGLRVVERVSSHAFRRIISDEFDGLNDSVNNLNFGVNSKGCKYQMAYLVFNARVFTLRVFTDENSVNIIVRRLEALDRDTWANVGK